MAQSLEIFLKSYPDGAPTGDIFEQKQVGMPSPGAGEMLLRVVWMSVDPYMRGRMRPDIKSYIPPFALGEALSGGAVCEVMESNIPAYAPGDYIVDFTSGWKSHAISNGDGAQKLSLIHI